MANPIFRLLFIIVCVAVPVCVIGAVVWLMKRNKPNTAPAADTQPEPSPAPIPTAPAPKAKTPAPAPAAEPQPARPAATPSSYKPTSKIFVNGGQPASGNIMGTLYVDGKALPLRYTDAPIEISVSAGRHHIVVEGGIYGDARIDRIMDLGVTDVWTVDMPGGNDADVIRHQLISSSEYRSALSQAGYRPTRKSL